jgi:RND family efflux transporter MFP subunit
MSSAPDQSTASARALLQRPELKAAQLKVQQAEYERKIKSAEYIPNLSLAFTYLSPLTAELVPKNIATVGLLLTWDVFDWGRKKQEIAEKSKTVAQERTKVSDTENRILLEVRSRIRTVQEKAALVHVNQLAQETAREKVRVAMDKYTQQAVLLHDVLQAQASRERAAAQMVADQASYEKARLDFERSSNLFATQSLTKADYDTSKARVEEAQARVEAARAQLVQAQASEQRVQAQYQGAQARVDGAKVQLDKENLALQDSAMKAPLTGVILKKSIEVGTLVEPRTVGFVLADTSSVKAIFGVPAGTVEQVQVGRMLTLNFEALPGIEFRGPITRIAPAADSKTRVFDVEVTLSNPRDQLKIGFIGALEIGGDKGLGASAVVPLTAIVRPKEDPAGYAVFVVQEQNGKTVARLRQVKLGDAMGNMIAVVDGVQLGERVITTGPALVADGAPVQIIP